jgi:hypothetical protein
LAGRSIHEIGKRDVVEVISAIERRGAPIAANKTLKSIKNFMRWCVGRAILDQSPAEGVPPPAKEIARESAQAKSAGYERPAINFHLQETSFREPCGRGRLSNSAIAIG